MKETIARWRCSFFGHTPDDSKSHYRIIDEVGEFYFPGYVEGHSELYSTCSVCGKDIRYIRFVDTWKTVEEFNKHILGDWVTVEESDSIEPDINIMRRC